MLSSLLSGGGASGPSPQAGAAAPPRGNLSSMPHRPAGVHGLMPPPPVMAPPPAPPRHVDLQILTAIQSLTTEVKSHIERQNGVNQKFELDLSYLRNNNGSSSSSGSKRSKQSQLEGSVDEDDGFDVEDEDAGVPAKRRKRISTRESITRSVVYKTVTLPSLRSAVDAVFRFEKYVEAGDFTSRIAHFHAGYVRKHSLVKTVEEVDEIFDMVRSEAAQSSAAISARLASSRASAGRCVLFGEVCFYILQPRLIVGNSARNMFCSVFNFPNLGCGAATKILRQGTSASFRICDTCLQNKRMRMFRWRRRSFEEVSSCKRRRRVDEFLEGYL